MKEQEKHNAKKYILTIIIAISLMIIQPIVVWGDDNEKTSNEVKVIANNITVPTQYSNVSHGGRIEINGNKLGTKVSKGYILIKVPKEYVQAVTVPNSEGLIKSISQEVVSDQLIVRVNLKDIDATTMMSFPFNLQFIGRDTPNGYHVKPDIEYIDETDQQLNVPASEVINNLHFETKYDPIQVRKYAISNALEGNGNDGKLIYGGLADEENTDYISSEAEDIVFQYRSLTKIPRNSYSYGDGIYKIRSFEKIVVEDVLPTYIDKDGQLRTAIFDPEKNPNWVPDGDKVRYVVQSVSRNINTGGADHELSNVKLRLSFPNAPTKVNITNRVNATFHPYNDPNEFK